MNQMEPGVLPNPKSLRLVRTLYDADRPDWDLSHESAHR